MGFKNHAQRKAVWASRNEKKGSPAKHCASDMMHSGGWQEMRKHNSPNTIGNKPAIKHNEKMRQQIGTFKMPHSPLNNSINGMSHAELKQAGGKAYDIHMRDHSKGTFVDGPLNKGHEVKKDSLGKDEAWAQWEKGYMDRTHKFKGTKFEKPLTAEDNKREMEMERGEFMYDPKIGQIRLRKKDDADQPIERQSSMKNPFKINRAHDIEKAPDRPMSDIQKTYDDNIDYAKSKLSGDKLKSYIEEEDAMLKDWRARKAKDAAASPLNKEGKKDACYHKVKSRVKVWPSAYASGQLVQCRKAGAANWGNKSKKK